MSLRALALAALLLVPSAIGAGFTLGAPRTLEASVGEDGIARFEMPLSIDASGELYAKLLNTPDNAVMHEPGWSIAHEIVAEDGTTYPMGGSLDGAPSQMFSVRQGERLSFVTRLTPPPRASAEASAFVALAYRAPSAGASAGSGATMDEARALTLLVRGIPAGGAPTGETAPDPTDPAPGAGEPRIPPVSPLVIQRPVEAADAPAASASSLEPALVLLMVVALSVVTIALSASTVALVLVVRELRRSERERARSVPVQEADPEPVRYQR